MSRPQNAYIIRTANPTRGEWVAHLTFGREDALDKARHLSHPDNEVTVRRQCDGALMAAFHSGGHHPLTAIQLNDFATWDAPSDPWHHLYNNQERTPTP